MSTTRPDMPKVGLLSGMYINLTLLQLMVKYKAFWQVSLGRRRTGRTRIVKQMKAVGMRRLPMLFTWAMGDQPEEQAVKHHCSLVPLSGTRLATTSKTQILFAHRALYDECVPPDIITIPRNLQTLYELCHQKLLQQYQAYLKNLHYRDSLPWKI